MKRRAVLASLVSLPLSASLPLAAAGQATCATPASAPGAHSAGIFIHAGRDRFERPLTVLGGLRLDVKVAPRDTAGALHILEHVDEAKGGPPRHVHHEQDEWFYVLEGAYVLIVGEERFELGPGDSVFAPRGIPHVWAHTSDGTGRLLLAFQPAGAMEAFFAELAALGSAPSPSELRPLFARHGMTVVGPALEA